MLSTLPSRLLLLAGVDVGVAVQVVVVVVVFAVAVVGPRLVEAVVGAVIVVSVILSAAAVIVVAVRIHGNKVDKQRPTRLRSSLRFQMLRRKTWQISKAKTHYHWRN